MTPARVLPSFVSLSEDIQFDDLVASARPRFQARSVEDCELASDVADQIPLLESAGRTSLENDPSGKPTRSE